MKTQNDEIRSRERWVPKGEVARHFSVSVRTVQGWLEIGCPSRLVGKQRRFLLSDVDHWLEATYDETMAA